MPRQAIHTREKFINAGIAVVLEKGFDNASVADIAAAAGAPKGSFFNHFASKDDFGAEIIRDYGVAEKNYLNEFIATFDGTPLETLRGIINQGKENFNNNQMSGCLVGNMTQTMVGRSEACRVAADEHFEVMRNILGQLIAEAQNAGEIDVSIDPARYASLLQSAIQGAKIIIISRQDTAPFDEIIEFLLTTT